VPKWLQVTEMGIHKWQDYIVNISMNHFSLLFYTDYRKFEGVSNENCK